MQAAGEAVIDLTKRQMNSIIKDGVKSAEAVNLVYVNNGDQGISRLKKGKDFTYFYQQKK